MRTLVVGGSGFIGPFVVSALRDRGHEVAVFSRNRSAVPAAVAHFAGDRRILQASAGELRAHKPDVVVDVLLSSGGQARDLVRVFSGVASRLVAVSSIDVYRACALLHRLDNGPLQQVPLTESSEFERHHRSR